MQLALRKEVSGAGTLIAQGQTDAEEVYLGFNEADQLVFRINGEEVTSTFSFELDEWYYLGLSYSFQNETANMFVAGAGVNPQVINTGDNNIFPAYDGIGRMFIGKQDYGDPTPFHGNIHELRIWDRALTLDEFSLTDGQILSDNQAGLLYNWRMDELEGDIAEDHVRRRDAQISGAQWAVYNGGNSAVFNGVGDYLTVQSGDVLITDDMDFTLEFWFKGNAGASGTLFSNGSGNGLLADSLNSWSINQNGDGTIELLHNGLSFTVTDNNYFDGEWHHLAIVLNRDANITSLVDGNIENAIPSSEFRQLTGADMTLGALDYQGETEPVVENFFSGQIDEFRFWNTNRKIEQIKRDKQINMSANEPGLLIYLPFEENIPIQGAPNLEPTFNEQIDSEVHTVEPNGTSLVEESPLIRIKRPIQSVAFDYSVNGDQIIITPTSSPELIENVTLDITVSNVRDLQGNVMASPMTWIAFMDKNQVVWGDDVLSFEKPVGEELSFTSSIVNLGGAEKAFALENLPGWLSASPGSGSVLPNSSVEVDFTVDPLVNIGDYTQDIYLLTDFDYPEKLSIDLKVRETPPDFDFDPADYQYSMGIIGSLEIRNIVSTDSEDLLVAFLGNEARGVQQLSYLEDLDRHLVYLDIYSNQSSGEELSFKIWDASAGILYSHIDPELISFQSNTLVGSPLNPQVFATDFEIEAEIPLSAGWNWYGHYLQNPDSANFDSIFESLSSTTGDQVNGQEHYANFSSGTGWIGPLENNGIKAEDGYKFFKNQPDTLILRGDIIDPSSRTIAMDVGWNWLGFISIRNQGIDQALGNLNPSDGDEIKGRSSFSVYVNQTIGWQGTLNTLRPGEGYMYKADLAQNFTYPYAGFFKSHREGVAAPTHPVWQVDYGVIRGLARFEEHSKTNLAFLTVNAENGMNLNLKLIDGEDGFFYPVSEITTFGANELKGSYEYPEVIFTEMLFCGESSAAKNPVLDVFPNLFTDQVRVKYNAPLSDRAARMVVYDMNGRVVYSQTVNVVDGQNEYSLMLSALAPGPYLLRLESINGAEMHKLIKSH
ncbi:MAG: T9SS type A sorting domain-containing protein [Flavobacteriales bacterium]|nr:T9SS type A sorting domain-containing protein [Flavobacteriales bacterium]